MLHSQVVYLHKGAGITIWLLTELCVYSNFVGQDYARNGYPVTVSIPETRVPVCYPDYPDPNEDRYCACFQIMPTLVKLGTINNMIWMSKQFIETTDFSFSNEEVYSPCVITHKQCKCFVRQ